MEANGSPVTTRVARWGAPVGEHSVSSNGRGSRCRAPKGCGGGRQSMYSRLFSRSRITGVGVRVPFPSRSTGWRSFCGRRPRLLRRLWDVGRSPALDGESSGGWRAGTPCVRRAPSPDARFKESLELVSTAPIGLARVLRFGGATSGRPGVVLSFVTIVTGEHV